MTEKQEKIIEAALELFTKDGFHATSTSKVAKQAGVSEGLIFRHFENKNGLLAAIAKMAEEKMGAIFYGVISESDPKEKIRLFLEMPFKIKEEDKEFWKLQFKLKWELNTHSKEKMKPVTDALVSAFKELGYDSPEMEAHFLLFFIEGISTSILRNNMPVEQKEVLSFLIQKYQL
jgi:AcrR family transcriptional regulator